MKKFLTAMLSVAILGAALGVSACGGDDKEFDVYAPDGAPALALTYGLAQDEKSEDHKFDYEIVDASTIAAQVTGRDPNADFCILPVNIAAKLLGTGETYKLLGTVTNGNMYFLTTEGNPVLTAENLDTLVGKKVGVVQLANVPGLTFQSVLKEAGVKYQIASGQYAEDAVNLIALQDATAVGPALGYDYYLCPEPAATLKISKTPLVAAGSLQELHGGGYPQAVLVAKAKIVEKHKDVVEEFIALVKASESYLETAEPATVLELLAEAREDGLTPAFTEQNLNATVIANCSVYFTESALCKAKVNEFLAELMGVSPEFTSTVSDSFYYMG